MATATKSRDRVVYSDERVEGVRINYHIQTAPHSIIYLQGEMKSEINSQQAMISLTNFYQQNPNLGLDFTSIKITREKDPKTNHSYYEISYKHDIQGMEIGMSIESHEGIIRVKTEKFDAQEVGSEKMMVAFDLLEKTADALHKQLSTIGTGDIWQKRRRSLNKSKPLRK
jgi:hypothetical protein